VIELWKLGGTAVYTDLSAFPLWYLPVSVFLYLFLHDTYFYWTHRIMHHRRIFPVVHRVHHESRPPTPWAAFSFHPWESVVGALFLPLVALVLPIHVGAALFILTLMTLAAVLNHSAGRSCRSAG
jgi:lathosterol oxidase